MKTLLLTSAAALGALLALPPAASGHGGTYRGPGDTVPPGAQPPGGGGGAVTPGPTGPGQPGPGGQRPGTPSGARPGVPGGGNPGGQPPVTGGALGGADLTHWEFWWGFNQGPFLQLKSSVYALGPATDSDEFFLGRGQRDQARDTRVPTVGQKRQVAAALLAALEREGDRSNDVLTGALVALAKIGDEVQEDGSAGFTPVFLRYLSHPNTEVAETAALCLGILASDRSIEPLIGLVADTPAARRSLSKTEVPYRMRAFAAYGLGLVGSRSSDDAAQRRIVTELVRLLESRSFATRDLEVAAMSALGLVPLAPLGAPPEGFDPEQPAQVATSRETQVAYLLDWLDPRRELPTRHVRHWHVRAHVPTALARLLQGPLVPDELRRPATRTLIGLLDEHAGVQDELRMSAALALGSLADADGDGIDAEARAALVRASRESDQQTRRFALIALAQAGARQGQGEDAWAGAAEAQGALQRPLARGPLRPWAALALGVHAHGLAATSATTGRADLCRALRLEAREERSPADAGAFLLALGLAADPESYDLLRERLDFFHGRPVARGHAALGLGLLRDGKAKEDLQALLAASRYKPDLLRQCAVALGLLGDKTVVKALSDELAVARGLATQAALAAALGTIGDREAIDPLLEMLRDQRLTQTARGFAAVALGMVCDKDLLPWNDPLSVGVNYRAPTPTLTGGGTGVLDIL